MMKPYNEITIHIALDTDFIETKAAGKLIRVSGEFDKQPFYLTLDISTAIKFAKTIRTEINKAKEVNDG